MASMIVLARLTLLVVFGLHGAAVGAAPRSPAAACEPPRSPLAEDQRKFHPGHYVSIGRAEVRNGIDSALEKGITGVQLRYRWAELEPTKDQYDFSAIERDLGTVTRNDSRLVVLIEDKSFDGVMPTPGYLQGKHTLRNRNGGYTAMRWDPYVNERFRQLVAKVGAKFDCHANFEGVAFQESSLSLDDLVLDANGYTPEKYRDQLIALLRSASESLPRSRVFWYMNFLPRRQPYIGEIAEALVGTGVVMGGPDVLPDNQSLAMRVYPYYDKFRGRLRLFNSMQHDSYRHPRSQGTDGKVSYWDMEDLFIFARDRLHVDYLFWEYRTKRQPADARDWSDARKVISRHADFAAGAPAAKNGQHSSN